MNTYIKQLIELIGNSIENAPPKSEELELEMDISGDFATEFLQGTPEKISSIVGIDKYHFPTSDKLNNEQILRLLTAIEKLLLSYNLEFMFPENVTPCARYKFIIDQWNSEHVHCKKAIVQIETCKFDEDKCPFPGDCNVCESFKCDNDQSNYLDKGIANFEDLTPDFTAEDNIKLRGEVDRFKSLIKQSENKDYIPGIHNYCDGRCNRCDFTNKCSSFSLNQELDKITQAKDDDTEGEDQLKIIMQATSEIIEEELTKRGVDVDNIMDELQPEPTNINPKHHIELQAESYAEKVKRWIESNQLEMESRLVSEENSILHQHTETITWFQLFIPAKVNRAVNGFAKDNLTNIDTYDATGSAKIALIAIDECIVAWQGIMEHLPQKEDSILSLLNHLSKLKNEIEENFKDVRLFVRPGFDE